MNDKELQQCNSFLMVFDRLSGKNMVKGFLNECAEAKIICIVSKKGGHSASNVTIKTYIFPLPHHAT